MRGRAIGVALAGVGGLVARPLAAKLHARLIAGCERMFEQMPDTFPPKRMMRGIEEIRATAQGLSRSSRRASRRERPCRSGEQSPTTNATRCGSKEERELAGVGASIPEHDLRPDA